MCPLIFAKTKCCTRPVFAMSELFFPRCLTNERIHYDVDMNLLVAKPTRKG